MSAWSTGDGLLRIGGLVLLFFGAVLIVRGLIGDRARGRRRCPRCWYDLSGSALLECPECGHRAESEPQLHRARRRWRLITTGVAVLLAAAQLPLAGTPGRTGWFRMVPTGVLVAIVRNVAAGDAASTALRERLQAGLILPWDRWAAAWRELSIAAIAWESVPRTRSSWPVGVPLRVDLGAQQGMWSEFDERTVRMWCVSPVDGEAIRWCSPPHIYSLRAESPPDWIELPAPVLGLNTYEFVTEVRGAAGVRRTGRARIIVEGVAATGAVIVPATAAAVVDEIRSSLQWWPLLDRQRRIGVVVAITDWIPAQNDVAYAYRVQLLRGGDVVSESIVEDAWMSGAFLPLPPPAEADQDQTSLPIADLSIRVLPAPEAALLNVNKARYWAGSFTVPLVELPLGHSETGEEVSIPPGTTSLPLDEDELDRLRAAWRATEPTDR